MFSKNREDKSQGSYRITQDGIDLLLPYLNDKRKVLVSKEQFIKLLEVSNFTFDELKTELKTDAFEKLDKGSAIMIFDKLAACIWIGVNNVSLMINKEETKSLKFLIN